MNLTGEVKKNHKILMIIYFIIYLAFILNCFNTYLFRHITMFIYGITYKLINEKILKIVHTNIIKHKSKPVIINENMLFLKANLFLNLNQNFLFSTIFFSKLTK